ncbi:MAG: malonate transporter subunit MadL [Cyclobacteriaceae bacterium]
MKIYGVAFLAACFLIGQIAGKYLGVLIGIDGNVGGVGLGMLLLVLVNDRYYKHKGIHPETKSGIMFWSSMYIPVVIAMSSVLNVKVAISGGWVAILSGIIATTCCYLLIPVLSRLSKTDEGPTLS